MLNPSALQKCPRGKPWIFPHTHTLEKVNNFATAKFSQGKYFTREERGEQEQTPVAFCSAASLNFNIQSQPATLLQPVFLGHVLHFQPIWNLQKLFPEHF